MGFVEGLADTGMGFVDYAVALMAGSVLMVTTYALMNSLGGQAVDNTISKVTGGR